jgi:hypothetical protein
VRRRERRFNVLVFIVLSAYSGKDFAVMLSYQWLCCRFGRFLEKQPLLALSAIAVKNNAAVCIMDGTPTSVWTTSGYKIPTERSG